MKAFAPHAATGALVAATNSVVRYGAPDSEILFLVHCGGGHAGWWTEVIPHLANDYAVITIDLSGHGDSVWRESYSPEAWASEIRDVLDELGLSRPITLVGHSMGGLVGIYFAATYPDRLKQLILIDPPVQHVELRDVPVRAKCYTSPDSALTRFNLRPPETIAPDERLREIGRQGLRQESEGWRWKYDPRASQRFTVPGVAGKLAKVICPIACIYGERSQYVDADTVHYIETLVEHPIEARVIAGAYHHVPLDAPQDVACAIRDVATTAA